MGLVPHGSGTYVCVCVCVCAFALQTQLQITITITSLGHIQIRNIFKFKYEIPERFNGSYFFKQHSPELTAMHE